jgi:hypothetical protein
MRTGHLALAAMLAFGAGAFTAAAQDSSAPQQDALAAASRRALEAKKDQAKSAKVFTNDNLPTDAAISFVGQTPAAPANGGSQNASAGQAAPSASATGAGDPKKAQEANAALEAAKEHLASVKKDLDIDQRTYQSDPNPDANKSGASDLQSEKDEIASKQDEVDAAQKAVDDLMAKMSEHPAASSSDNSPNSSSSPSDNGSSAPAAPAVTTGGISLSATPSNPQN